MRLTNAQRADLIDALASAISLFKGLIESEIVPGLPRRQWDAGFKAMHDDYTARIRRYRKLREQLVHEEFVAGAGRKVFPRRRRA